MKKTIITLSLVVLALVVSKPIQAQTTEVVKGGIPAEYLETSLKSLPIGIQIWDEEETLEALKGEGGVLLVDTRPKSFYTSGTIKDSVMLLYNKDEVVADSNKGETSVLTKESLEKAMSDAGVDKVMFFCQGPKCHRSYNAALRAVNHWGLSADNVIWGRAGYPLLLKFVQSDPKLARRMNKYFDGDVLNQ